MRTVEGFPMRVQMMAWMEFKLKVWANNMMDMKKRLEEFFEPFGKRGWHWGDDIDIGRFISDIKKSEGEWWEVQGEAYYPYRWGGYDIETSADKTEMDMERRKRLAERNVLGNKYVEIIELILHVEPDYYYGVDTEKVMTPYDFAYKKGLEPDIAWAEKIEDALGDYYVGGFRGYAFDKMQYPVELLEEALECVEEDEFGERPDDFDGWE